MKASISSADGLMKTGLFWPFFLQACHLELSLLLVGLVLGKSKIFLSNSGKWFQ